MKEVSLPLPPTKEDEPIEIKVSLGLERKEIDFKVVPFIWDNEDELSENKDDTSVSLARISRLKKSIENYDKSWELLQIFAPLEDAKFIRVLYRKRS